MNIKRLSLIVLFALTLAMTSTLLVPVTPTRAATITAQTGGGDWNSGSTWVGGSIPQPTDDVIIPDNSIVIVPSGYNAVCNSIVIQGASGPAKTNGITISSGQSLTVSFNVTMNGPSNNLGNSIINIGSSGTLSAGSIIMKDIASFSGANTIDVGSGTLSAGSVSMQAPSANNATNTINIGSGTLSAGSISITGGSSVSRRSEVTVSTGTIDVSGNISFGAIPPAVATAQRLTFTDTGTLYIGGNLGSGGTFTASTGTVECDGGVAQYIGAYTYNNLTINNSSGVTLYGNATVNGILYLQSGNLSTDSFILNMGASATTSSLSTGEVIGIIRRTSMVAGVLYTFGSQYTTVTFHGGGTIPTEVSVKITTGSAPSWKADAIERIYDFIQVGGVDCYATVSAHYLDSELNGNTESELVWWYASTPLWSATEYRKSSQNTDSNWIIVTSVPISLWTNAFSDQEETLADASTATNLNVWTGNALSNDWNTAGNWSDGIPTSTSDVIIPDPATTNNYSPYLPSGGTTINSLTIQTDGVLYSDDENLTIDGGAGAWINYGGTFDYGTSTVIFTNADAATQGTATFAGETNFYNVQIGSGATLEMIADSIMRIAGAMTNNGTWDTGLSSNTIEYNGSVDQDVVNPNGSLSHYDNLILSSSGTKTMPASTLNISGDFTNSSTFDANGGTIMLDGTVAQNIYGTSTTTFNNLILNNSSGLTIDNDEIINGTLTLASGLITTGDNTVIIGSSGHVSGGSESSYVFGNMQKYIATGATSQTFEIGSANNYDPVTVVFGNVSSAGNLTAKVTAGEHPNIATSTIDSSQDVNAYWTLTNSGISFDEYSATFTFAPGDIDSGADPSAFFVERYNGGWTYPTIGTITATSTEATSLTSFSDFAVGEVDEYILTCTAGAHGSITAPATTPTTHSKGAIVTITAVADPTYHFVNWTGDVGTIANVNSASTTITMNGNYTIQANFSNIWSVYTATGTGIATFSVSEGLIENLSAVDESSLPAFGKLCLFCRDGFFSFEITGVTPGNTVTVTITLPSNISDDAEYWNYGPTLADSNPHWYQLTMGDNDGDSVITITLVDGGLGDDDLAADGAISTQGGPGTPPFNPHCFIATAAYGSAMAEEVDILRDFRDEYMVNNPVGKALVDFYYEVSPPIAEFIDQHPALKPAVRSALWPVVILSQIAVNTTLVEKIAILFSLAIIYVMLALWLTRSSRQWMKHQ